jgi:transposase-like protein
MLTKERLFQLYYGDDLTTTGIAKMYGVTATTIQNRLREFGIPSKPRHQIARSIRDRFNDSYRIDENGCWIWVKGYAGGKTGRYGMLRLPSGKAISAHRLSYELHNGPISEPGLLVCHRCDVTGCVNPSHLFLGTSKDNSLDMMAKGRFHGPRKITSLDVEEIRNSCVSSSELAAKFGIGRSHVWRIRTGRANATKRAQMNLR